MLNYGKYHSVYIINVSKSIYVVSNQLYKNVTYFLAGHGFVQAMKFLTEVAPPGFIHICCTVK